ncbi:PREDICTED: myb-related transcription factor, partner of profilin-like [Priapulus caudatus]|uniref:Regulatory protein zeste n=1 Tax=Priapulus caudatus TaxID=37621 RepID=A0ABM1EU93_PRICU|nr:PREDICTED: myb-related transcription factor, partner of profilin-like [Priapulus caudatus]
MADRRIKRSRRPKWSEIELQVLLDEVKANQCIFFNRLCTTVSNMKKKRVWIAVADRVNTVSEIQRSPRECRSKWIYLQSDVRRKAARVRGEHAHPLSYVSSHCYASPPPRST